MTTTNTDIQTLKNLASVSLTNLAADTRLEEKFGIVPQGQSILGSNIFSVQCTALLAAVANDQALHSPQLTVQESAELITSLPKIRAFLSSKHKTIAQALISNVDTSLNGTISNADLHTEEADRCRNLGMPVPKGDVTAKIQALDVHTAKMENDFAAAESYGISNVAQLKSKFDTQVGQLRDFYNANNTYTTANTAPAVDYSQFEQSFNAVMNPSLSPYQRLGINEQYVAASGASYNLNNPQDVQNLTNNPTDLSTFNQLLTNRIADLKDISQKAHTESLNPASIFAPFKNTLDPSATVNMEKSIDEAFSRIDSEQKRLERATSYKQILDAASQIQALDVKSLLGLKDKDLNILSNKFDPRRGKVLKKIDAAASTCRTSLDATLNQYPDLKLSHSSLLNAFDLLVTNVKAGQSQQNQQQPQQAQSRPTWLPSTLGAVLHSFKSILRLGAGVGGFLAFTSGYNALAFAGTISVMPGVWPMVIGAGIGYVTFLLAKNLIR